MNEQDTPQLARRLLDLALPSRLREDVQGDLFEVYRIRCEDHGRGRAGLWYWRQAVSFSVRFLLERMRHRITLDPIRRDCSIALRGIARSPGFAAAVILVLSLGIGANHTMFRVVSRVVLRPPEHVEDADRVVRVFQRVVSSDLGRVEFKSALGYPGFRDFDGAPFFTITAAYASDTRVVGEGETAEPVLSQWASADLFPLLGVKPALGRFYSPEEDRVGAAGTVVLSWSYWKRRFGGDPQVLGRSLRVGEGHYVVIGVAPRGFTGASLAPVQLWLPLHVTAGLEAGDGWASARVWNWLHIVARLAPGVTHEEAEAEAILLARRRDGTGDAVPVESLVLTSLRAADEPEAPVWASTSIWLVGISMLVWAIAAANVANLFLARETRRRRETAVRLALGVTRSRVLGQFLIEVLLLALPAAGAAALVSHWSGRAVGRMLLPELSFEGTEPTGPILVFTLATALLTAALAGIAPALQAAGRDVAVDLRAGPRDTQARSRLQDAFLVSQTAFSVVMLVAAGLFVRSLGEVESAAHVGFDPDPLMVAEVFLVPGPHDHVETQRLFRAAIDRLDRLPGVESVAAATHAPFTGGRGVHLERPGGDPLPAPPARTVGPDQVHVTPQFFSAVGLQIVEGRAFRRSEDMAESERVAIVSRSMADHYWPREDPLGRCLWVDWKNVCTRIVGVSSDIRWNGPGWRPPLLIYFPLGQGEASPRDLLVRVSESGDLGPTLRRELLGVSPRIRFVGVRPLGDLVAAHSAAWRLGATMGLLFGSLALGVASVGLYSLMAFRVAQKRRELALRAALGASGGRITGMVLKDVAVLVATGVSVGFVTAALLSGRVEPLLVGVAGVDLPVYVVAAGALSVAGLVAGLPPAYRATRVDPGEALRGD